MADAELRSHLLVTGFQSPLTLDLARRLADRANLPVVNLDMLPGVFAFVNSWRAGRLDPSPEEADYVLALVSQIIDKTPEDTVFHGSCLISDVRGLLADKYAVFVHMGGVRAVVDARMATPLSIFTNDKTSLSELLHKHYDSQIPRVWGLAARDSAIPIIGSGDDEVLSAIRCLARRFL